MDEKIASFNWSEEELILTLQVYLDVGNAGPSNAKVKTLSQNFSRLKLTKTKKGVPGQRTLDSIALKLANFASLDPQYRGTGMSGRSRKDEKIWAEFSGDEDLLSRRVNEILGLAIPFRDESNDRISVEQVLKEAYVIPASKEERTGLRREALLVKNYVEYAVRQGLDLGARRFSGMRCDLYDFTNKTIIEAKGAVTRESIRMAIGQLLEYQFLTCDGSRIAILLPRQPSKSILSFLEHLKVRVIWQTEDGWSEAPEDV